VASATKTHSTLTKEKILGAAIHLLQQRGFSGLGMRQIADCLQIKAPSLYHHFASKEDLARYALRQYREEQAARLLTITQLENSAEKLRAYSELFAVMLDDGKRPCLYLVMVREPSFREESCTSELRLFAKQNVDWLEEVLREGKGELYSHSGVSERDMAEMIFASLEGIMVISLSDENPSVSFRSRANNLLKVVMPPQKRRYNQR